MFVNYNCTLYMIKSNYRKYGNDKNVFSITTISKQTIQLNTSTWHNTNDEGPTINCIPLKLFSSPLTQRSACRRSFRENVFGIILNILVRNFQMHMFEVKKNRLISIRFYDICLISFSSPSISKDKRCPIRQHGCQSSDGFCFILILTGNRSEARAVS